MWLLNVDGSIFFTWLLDKHNIWSEFNSLNVDGPIIISWLLFNSNLCNDELRNFWAEEKRLNPKNRLNLNFFLVFS